jgi:hypothetical protein
MALLALDELNAEIADSKWLAMQPRFDAALGDFRIQ